jgi:hypothetical protein
MTNDLESSRPPKPAFARLSALFRRGEVVDLSEHAGDEGERLLIWMNALTHVEREEAVLDGAVAQALSRQVHGPGSPAYTALEEELHESDRPAVIEQLLKSRSSEAWQLAQDDLHADEYWRGDRLALIERADASMNSGMPVDEAEMAALNELNEKYLADWMDAAKARIERMRREYEDTPTADLIEAHLKQWADTKALRAQMTEYRVSQLYLSTRVCSATATTAGGYDHTDCQDHSQLMFPNRNAVRQAPDELLEILYPVADRIDREGGDALGKR